MFCLILLLLWTDIFLVGCAFGCQFCYLLAQGFDCLQVVLVLGALFARVAFWFQLRPYLMLNWSDNLLDLVSDTLLYLHLDTDDLLSQSEHLLLQRILLIHKKVICVVDLVELVGKRNGKVFLLPQQLFELRRVLVVSVIGFLPLGQWSLIVKIHQIILDHVCLFPHIQPNTVFRVNMTLGQLLD